MCDTQFKSLQLEARNLKKSTLNVIQQAYNIQSKMIEILDRKEQIKVNVKLQKTSKEVINDVSIDWQPQVLHVTEIVNSKEDEISNLENELKVLKLEASNIKKDNVDAIKQAYELQSKMIIILDKKQEIMQRDKVDETHNLNSTNGGALGESIERKALGERRESVANFAHTNYSQMQLVSFEKSKIVKHKDTDADLESINVKKYFDKKKYVIARDCSSWLNEQVTVDVITEAFIKFCNA